MKKIILTVACLMCVVGLAGCESNCTDPPISTYFDFCHIPCDELSGEMVFYDKNTGVMYFSRPKGGITPIYNADGTLKLYKEE